MRRSLLVVFAAAVASGFVITSALADASFTDPAGDALGNAPDITAVQVSSDSGGQILFSVTVSNLTPESAVWLRLDTDKDATTGSGGAEYVLLWRSSATADKNGWWFGKWDGSQLNLADHPTVQVSLAPDGVQFSINKSDLGGTSCSSQTRC